MPGLTLPNFSRRRLRLPPKPPWQMSTASHQTRGAFVSFCDPECLRGCSRHSFYAAPVFPPRSRPLRVRLLCPVGDCGYGITRQLRQKRKAQSFPRFITSSCLEGVRCFTSALSNISIPTFPKAWRTAQQDLRPVGGEGAATYRLCVASPKGETH